jgi:ATP-binding cassette subfamily B protein
MLSRFPHYQQLDQKDCGPTCIKIIAKHYGKNIPIQRLRDLAQTNRIGTSLKGLSYASEQIGFRTLSVKITLKDLETVPQPCIIYWNAKHFIVLYKVKKGIFYVSDPAFGLIKYTTKEFLKGFTGQTVEESKAGYVMLFDTTPDFQNK